MSCCLSGHRLWADANRAAKAALFIAFVRETGLCQALIPRAILNFPCRPDSVLMSPEMSRVLKTELFE